MTYTAYVQTSDEVVILGEICADDIQDAIERARKLAGPMEGAICITSSSPPKDGDRKLTMEENPTKFYRSSGLKSFLNPPLNFKANVGIQNRR